MELPEQRTSALRTYVQVLWRRKGLVVGVFVAFVAVAMAVSLVMPPKYKASAQLRYQKEADISSITGTTGGTAAALDVERQLETAAKVISTKEMAVRAADELGLASPDDIGADVSAEPVPDTSLLTITAVSAKPQIAAEVANAYAEALIAARREASIQQYEDAEKIITRKLKRYNTPVLREDPGYSALSYRLQDVLMLKAMAQGDMRSVAVAQVATSPYTPDHRRDLAVAVVLGLVVATASAFVAEQLDIRLHDPDEIAQGLQLPVIGRIPQVSKEIARGSTLAVVVHPDGLSAEAYRMLRGNLDFVDLDHEVKSVIVTSCQAGEGKTSTVCNLAVTLARVGKRVVVVDADLRRPRVHTYFDVSNDVGLSTVVAGKAKLVDVLKPVVVSALETGDEADDSFDDVLSGGASRLYVLGSGPIPPNPGDIVTSRHFVEVMTELASEADLVLVDAPPFMAVGDVAALAPRVSGVLVVMRMGTVTRAMVKEARTFLEQLPCRKMGIVVTNQGTESGYNRYAYRQKRRDETAGASAVMRGA